MSDIKCSFIPFTANVAKNAYIIHDRNKSEQRGKKTCRFRLVLRSNGTAQLVSSPLTPFSPRLVKFHPGCHPYLTLHFTCSASLRFSPRTKTNKSPCALTHPHTVDVRARRMRRACMQAVSHERQPPPFYTFRASLPPSLLPLTHTSLNYSFCSLLCSDMLGFKSNTRLKSS